MRTAKEWLSGLPEEALFVSGEVTIDTSSRKTVDFRLRGAWESTDTNIYSGRLKIGHATITITGYSEGQTPPPWKGGDDSKRPFRDFAKAAPLGCYTEDGTLFIKTAGDVLCVPYCHSAEGLDKYLLFAFGGRQEALKRTGR